MMLFRAHCRFCTIIRKTAKQAWTFGGFRVINVLRPREGDKRKGQAPGKDTEMKKYELNVDDRKVLVKRLGELTGMKPAYTYMPRCAYECGAYAVERNGDLMVEEAEADADIINSLLAEGLIKGETAAEELVQDWVPDAEYEQEAEAESAVSLGVADAERETGGLTISLPMTGHTGDFLRRLVNMVYSRGTLLSRATSGSFRVDKELITALNKASIPVTATDFTAKLNEYASEHGGLDGLALETDKVSFTGFPLTDDSDRNSAFQQLACLMNRMAIEQKRIQAKVVNDDNEKYAFRIWLLRLGMSGSEYKTARKILMENLSGHAAFRTKEEEEKWKARQKEKRDELKAAKAGA